MCGIFTNFSLILENSSTPGCVMLLFDGRRAVVQLVFGEEFAGSLELGVARFRPVLQRPTTTTTTLYILVGCVVVELIDLVVCTHVPRHLPAVFLRRQ